MLLVFNGPGRIFLVVLRLLFATKPRVEFLEAPPEAATHLWEALGSEDQDDYHEQQ